MKKKRLLTEAERERNMRRNMLIALISFSVFTLAQIGLLIIDIIKLVG